MAEYKVYKYGMRLRGYSLGCQPMKGLCVCVVGDKEYYNYLYYSRKLTDKELENYELDFIGEEESK